MYNKDNEILLSIIIPVYNNEKYIEKCLVSILTQNISIYEYEVLIINDGSIDSTLEKINFIINKFNNITLLNQKNKGVAEARNVGINIAKGKYILFIDADDYLLKNGLYYLKTHYIDRFPNYDIYKFHSKTVDLYYNRKFDSISHHTILFKGSFNDFNKLFDIGWSIWSCVFSREFLLKNRILFKSYKIGEDVDFLLSAITLPVGKIVYTNLNIYRYVCHRNSTLNLSNKKFLKDSIYDFLKLYEQIKKRESKININRTFILNKIINLKKQSFIRLCSACLPYKEIIMYINKAKNIGFYPIKEKNNYLFFLFNILIRVPIFIFFFSFFVRYLYLPLIKPLLPRN